ncbi:uncharacterized protein LOC142749808 [Rhinoderma darwinii]|uniref:uncharacterized protein LOC142749808 n=1 Tax=Rhinoderma darwinii TaxID=43563 RepID=UPI003F663947
MERRQRPAENGTRDRPSFANHPVLLQPRFSHEVPQHRGALPRVFYPDGGAELTGRWETRSPHEVGRPGFLPQDGSEQRDGHLDFTQHEYHGHEPQQRGGPRGISQHGPLRPQLFPHGGTRPGIPHHGPLQPAIIRNDGSLPDTSQQRAPELLQGAIQYNATPQSLHAQTPEAAFQGRPHQMRPGDRAETSAMSHQGSSRENVSDHRGESQDVAQQRNSHENIYYQSGERQSSIQDREGVHKNIYYQSGERQSSIQHREGDHKNIYYQSGERQSSIQDREGVQHISSDAMYSERPPPRSEHGAYQPDLFHHGGPSSSTGPNPAISPYSGMAKQCDSRSSGPLSGPQPAGFHHDFPHNRSNLQHTYQDEGAQRGMSCGDSQAGIYNLNTPAVPETFSYRAPSPGLQQYSPQLQPAHTQNTPYINDPQQGHYHLPPLHGSLSNPSYALHSPVGPVFSGSHEEGDLEVSRLQRLGNHPHHLLSQQQSIIHQDRRPDLDPIMPTRMSGGRCFEVDSPFPHNEVPDGRRDPNLLLHHGSPFFSEPTPTTHIEDHFMHLDRKSDKDKGGPADKEVFVQWLSSFLSCRRKKPPSKTDAVQAYSIADARGLIYGTLRLVSQLDSLCQALEDSNKEGEPRACDYKKAADVRVDLERRMKELEKPGYIQGVKRKLDGVRRKRLRWQRRRLAEEEEEKAATERSAEREAGIDLWRMQCIQKVEEKKRERELKATADRVLGEVRKKQKG